ncbi:hypothetical protein AOQ84DRAFT_354577 [Glonium stellatum]|uniref:Uncharacterized protein n=1 Tax=Glonium stellatum TaxID=574774 RepID=A0A8E2F0N1_9PEZI|nr:hypothetical protein AOQ84DRAFT_354577 [Glonium stellatum]
MSCPTLLSRFRNRAIHFIIDWDGTITKKDTLEFLGKVASQPRKKMKWVDPSINDDRTTQMSWGAIVNAYLEDFTAHQSQYRPAKPDRKTISEERSWLASLMDVELRSVTRVEKSRIFGSITAADIKEEAKQAVRQGEGELQIRDGWHSLCLKILERRGEQERHGDTLGGIDQVTILSVNWSQLFINECLVAAKSPITASKSKGLDRNFSPKHVGANLIKIYANEIQGLYDSEGSSGMLTSIEDRNIRTSSDKLRRLLEMKNSHDFSRPQPLIYIGDSMTDFECLLEADLGICIRDNPSSSGQRELTETFDRVGISVPHIGELSKADHNGVVWAQNFEELVDFLVVVS